MTNSGIIGRGSRPPWYREDSGQRYFPELTADHTIIMSKKSYDAFGYCKYLAKKIILVGPDCSLEEAMSSTQDEAQVFIAGGKSLFVQTLPMIDGIYIAKIYRDHPGNINYPPIPHDMRLQFCRPYADDTKVVLEYYERSWEYDK